MAEALRVAIVRHGYYPADPRVRREVNALLDSGVLVDVVCLRGPGEAPREVVDGVEVFRLPVEHRRESIRRYLFEYGSFFLLAAVKVSRLHSRRRYAVVQVNTMPDFLVFAALVPKLLGASVVLDMHELMPELFSEKFGASTHRALLRVVVASERISTRFADRVIAVSEPTRRIMVQRGVPDAKITVVMNSPDEDIFRPAAEEIDERRRRALGEPISLVSHGTLVERYGFQTAIRAVKLLEERRPRAQLTIIGQGEYRPNLEALVAELGLEERVEFVPYTPLEEIPRYLGRADIGVVANERDVFTDLVVPTKLLEYVAMGVPSVVSRCRAVEEYFDETMVQFFEPGDPAGLAKAVDSLAQNPDEAFAMAERARDGFLGRYGWNPMKREYLRVIEGLAGGGET